MAVLLSLSGFVIALFQFSYSMYVILLLTLNNVDFSYSFAFYFQYVTSCPVTHTLYVAACQ